MSGIGSGSFIDFSFVKGKKQSNYANSPKTTSREELLGSKIVDITVLFTLLGKEEVKKSTRFRVASTLVPIIDFVQHAKIIAHTENDLLILIEYGGYDERREGDYQSQVHYFNYKDGLRFVEISKMDSNHIELLSNSYYYCDVGNKMTLNEMIERTKYQNGYHLWDKESYNLASENCQLFVACAVKVLNATRKNSIDRIRFCAKREIPFRVLKALEKNEKEFSRIVEKIPVIGYFYGIGLAVSKSLDTS